jgi:hypothetical protein
VDTSKKTSQEKRAYQSMNRSLPENRCSTSFRRCCSVSTSASREELSGEGDSRTVWSFFGVRPEAAECIEVLSCVGSEGSFSSFVVTGGVAGAAGVGSDGFGACISGEMANGNIAGSSP